jgi:Kef-type K+ transport system membrane component KefB
MALDVPTLLLQLAAVLVATRAGGALARRLGQPSVVGEIAAGLCLGPSLFGRVAPGLSAALFPPASIPVLQGLSQLGLLLFMFRVGSEVDLARLRSLGRVAAVTSLVSIVVPLLLGTAAGAVAAPGLDPGHATFTTAVFVGVALSVTAFPVLARILSERGLSRTAVGTMALACAAVDDVSAWVLLAALSTWARSAAGAATLFYTASLVASHAAVLLLVVRPALARLHRRWGDAHPGWQPLSLVLLLLSAAATEWVGVHALFGAFLSGVVMPRGEALRRTTTQPLEVVTDLLLLPLFFAITGLRTDLGRLQAPGAWLLAVLVIATAVVGKLAASSLAARALGTPWRDAIELGILLNTRGLVELVILGAGLEMGVVGPSLYSVLVLMALLTTVMTSPLLQALGPRADVEAAPPLAAVGR